jgi:hypothetical protein
VRRRRGVDPERGDEGDEPDGTEGADEGRVSTRLDCLCQLKKMRSPPYEEDFGARQASPYDKLLRPSVDTEPNGVWAV